MRLVYIDNSVGLNVEQHDRLLLVIEGLVPHKGTNLAVQHVDLQARLGGVVVRVRKQIVVGLVGCNLQSGAPANKHTNVLHEIKANHAKLTIRRLQRS